MNQTELNKELQLFTATVRLLDNELDAGLPENVALDLLHIYHPALLAAGFTVRACVKCSDSFVTPEVDREHCSPMCATLHQIRLEKLAREKAEREQFQARRQSIINEIYGKSPLEDLANPFFGINPFHLTGDLSQMLRRQRGIIDTVETESPEAVAAVDPTIVARAQYDRNRQHGFCGCCGFIKDEPQHFWCRPCEGHVLISGEFHTRTHYGRFGTHCPQQNMHKMVTPISNSSTPEFNQENENVSEIS